MRQEAYAIPFSAFLPTSVKEMKSLGWDAVDVVLFSADAYIDHPSFGTAVIARVLEKLGVRVAVVPQPNWKDDLRDFKKFGNPNMYFAISGGCMDSMVNHYTANKRLRAEDAYTPGGEKGKRPDRAVISYSHIIKKLYPDVPLLIGGIEASLRRFAHYDYWSDSIKPSILVESKADYLIYGMGEKAVVDFTTQFIEKKSTSALQSISQLAYLTKGKEVVANPGEYPVEVLPSYEQCQQDKNQYVAASVKIEESSNQYIKKILVQEHEACNLIVNPPNDPLSTEALDAVYDLSYMRVPHPRYWGKEVVPAFRMIKDSVTIHRGCFGGCAFCALSVHQGKSIASRSSASIFREVKAMVAGPAFSGVLTDLGGPSANMYQMQGINIALCKSCKRNSCIFPSLCRNLQTDHAPLTKLYKEIASIPGVKNVFIGSGVRYDLILPSYNKKAGRAEQEYLKQLILHHVSGRLKVAPEHTESHVLRAMGKPGFSLFEELCKQFYSITNKAGKKQEIIPYFISNHPGCTETDMLQLLTKTKQIGLKLEQVQDFTPTPMTRSSVMYYTGKNPETKERIYVARSPIAREHQHRHFFWYKPENRKWANAKLKSTGSRVNPIKKKNRKR